MKAKKLITHLSHIETLLNHYSFEELSSEEGQQLKQSFIAFKKNLEAKMFQPSLAARQDFTESLGDELEPSKEIVEKGIMTRETMLIAKVSHEIRTPLNGIIGFTDLLKEDNLNIGQLEKVEAIQAASNSLMEIINEFLEYSKLAEGLEQIEQIDFNFNSLINNVVYLCNTLITEKHVNLKTNIDPGIPTILKGDPSKLSQILLNLIGNSIKFVEKGEITLTITQKSQRKKKVTLAFCVSDTGIGISKNQIKHIFDSFKQAENDTKIKYGGTGLGLSIVKQLIDLLDGNIEVTSILGQGTEFNFNIPYTKGEEGNIVEEQFNSEQIQDSLKQIKDMNILVFEDNAMNQRLIEQRLTTWGCNVYVTDNGNYGIKYLENNRVDLVLMDLRMPGMNGYEITERIRGHNKNSLRKIPIVAITADFTIQERERCETYGLNDFILKPFNPEELLTKLIQNSKRTKGNFISPTINREEDKTGQTNQLISLIAFQEESMGEIDFLEELIRLFKQNILEFIGAFTMHLKNKDFERIVFAAHKIKSGLAMIKAHSLLKIVEKVKRYAEEDQCPKELEKLKESFIKEYAVVEEAIVIEMDKIRN